MEEKVNQILYSKENLDENFTHKPKPKKTFSMFFKIQFVFCIIVVFAVSGYFIYLQFDKRQKEELSKQIVDRFSITNLYKSNESNYSASRQSYENTYQTNSLSFSVIGLIEIDSLGINYPIINEFSYDLLKIAPCKFLGPDPNQVRKYVYCRT